MTRLAFLSAALLVSAGSTHAATLRVLAPGTTPTGGAWSDASVPLAEVLSTAVPGDEVWVAQGRHAGPIRIPAGVAVLGGFRGDETASGQRNARLHATELAFSATPTPTVTFLPGTAAATLDGIRFRGPRNRGTVLAATNAAPRIVDVDLVLPGNATGAFPSEPVGVFEFVDSEVVLEGLHANVATGGEAALVRLRRGGGRIQDGRYFGNLVFPPTTENAFGLILLEDSSPRIERNWFAGNDAAHGAGISALGTSAPLIRNNLFTDASSSAPNLTAAADFSGGSALYADSDASPSFLHNTVVVRYGPPIRLEGLGGRVAHNVFALTEADPVVGSRGQLSDNVWTRETSTAAESPQPITGFQGNRVVPASEFVGEPTLGRAWFRDVPGAVDSSERDPDAGDTDFLGQPRVQGAAPDPGAFEHGPALASAMAVRRFRVSPAGDDLNDGTDPSRPFRTVDAALRAAAREGGRVEVEAGLYPEHSLVLGYGVDLAGGYASGTAEPEPDRNRSVLDGGGADTVLFHAVATLSAGSRTSIQTVSGLTFRNGFSTTGGGAMRAASLRIVGNRFEENRVEGTAPRSSLFGAVMGGGAVYIEGGNAWIAGNRFERNWVSVAAPTAGGSLDVRQGSGGAILLSFAAATIRDNLFVANTNRVASSSNSGSAVGIHPSFETTFLENNTFLDNQSVGNGTLAPNTLRRTAAMVYRSDFGSSALSLVARNNLFAFNNGTVGKESSLPAALEVSHNVAFANRDDTFPAGVSNIVTDPGFAGPGAFPRLAANSPLRDAGAPDTSTEPGRTDVEGRPRRLGERVDIGAFEYDPAAPAASVPVVRVRVDGDDAADGLSWSTAKRSIQAAVDSLGLAGGEVWVQGGTHAGFVRSREGVRLYGGFAGTESRREDRDWGRQPTTLSPPSGGLDGGPLVVLRGEGVATEFSGFRVVDGRGRPAGGLSLLGGGRVGESAFLRNTATNLVTSGTYAAGAIYHSGKGRLRIENSLFATNTSTGITAGSAMAAIASQEASGGVDLRHTTFQANAVPTGGALLRVPATPVSSLANSLFVGTGNTSALGTLPATTEAFGNLFWNATAFAGISTNGWLRADPLFLNAAAGDLRLAAGSPARGAAVTALPADEPRDLSGRLDADGRGDIGAFEFFPPPPADFTVTILDPLPGATLTALQARQVSFTVNATNRIPSSSVLLVDGVPVVTNGAQTATQPLRWSAPLVGEHSLVVRVLVDGFQPAESPAVTVNVPIPAGDTPPTIRNVAVNSSAGVAVAPTVVTLVASVADTGSVQGAWAWYDSDGRLLRSGTALGTATSGPLSFPRAATNTYRLRVRDRVGQTTETNVTVRIAAPTLWNVDLPATVVLRALNEAGQVAGSVESEGSQPLPAIVEDGRVRPLVAIADGTGTALALNRDGLAAGVLNGSPTLFRAEGPLRLDPRPGAATAVGDSGVVVGFVTGTDSRRRPFSWRQGVFTELELGDGTEGLALAVNAAGLVGGQVADAQGRMQAVLWREGRLEWLTRETVEGAVRVVTAAGIAAGEDNAQPAVWNAGVRTVLPTATGQGAVLAADSDGLFAGHDGVNPVVWVGGAATDPRLGLSGTASLGLAGGGRVGGLNRRGDLLLGNLAGYRLVRRPGTVDGPRLRLVRRNGDAGLQLEIGSSRFLETVDVVESSEDLVEWRTEVTQPTEYPVESGSGGPLRFYRIRRVGP